MKAVTALLVLIFSFEASAQTIADVARQERARRNQIQAQNSKTYNNQTAPSTAAPAPSSNPTAPAPSSNPVAPTSNSPTAQAPAAAEPTKEPVPPAPSGPTDNKGRDEKYWRTAFQQARDDATRADAKVVLVDLKIKQLNTELLRQSDIYNRENRIGPEITAAQKEMETAAAEAAQARQKIADLEEELRRSNGLPGWAR